MYSKQKKNCFGLKNLLLFFIVESVFDRVVGEITKGYQTTEQILKNGKSYNWKV